MNLKAIRQRSSSTGTPGLFRVEDNWWSCNTLELPWKNNQRGISCIFDGIYSCDLWYSETMKRMVVRIQDKHGRKDCLIHSGNFAGDVSVDENKDGVPDLVTQVHGCIEVGNGYGMIQRKDGKKQLGVLNSGKTLDELVNTIGKGPHQLTIEWAPGEEPLDMSDLLGKGK